jgi:1-acyl-sn-glycerol-3-phosphate acyltransferase
LPKFTDAGVMVSCPTAGGGVVPMPLRGTFTLGPVTKRSPPLVPAACGANVRFTVTLCPPLKLIGSAGPLSENPLPVIWKAYSFVFEERVLVSTTATVDFAPTLTWPNETLAGLLFKLSRVAPVPPSPN